MCQGKNRQERKIRNLGAGCWHLGQERSPQGGGTCGKPIWRRSHTPGIEKAQGADVSDRRVLGTCEAQVRVSAADRCSGKGDLARREPF